MNQSVDAYSPLESRHREFSFGGISNRRIAGALICCALLALIVPFDENISRFANGLARRWWLLDRIIEFLASNELVKGGVVLTVYFLVWFGTGEPVSSIEPTNKRQTLLYTLLLCVPGLVFTRAIAWVLPFRARPILDPDLSLTVGYGFEPDSLWHWSCFPSDHAALFFALATGMFLADRKCGILLYAHTVLVVVLPRLFLGMHYLSDILVGALFGIALSYSVKWPALRTFTLSPALRLLKASPGLFYAGFFLLCHETGEVYHHLMTAARGAWQVLIHISFN
jgi:undecaprenyl-diphosphatase